ncbi:hypothetical protein RRG08_025391 [Elysia crispata]|nr:hypothetical protein RRG08_025391 [Elysia crispata]
MVAANDVRDVVDLLIELAQIRESVRTTIPNNEDEEITMMELGDKYPILGLARTIREFFAAAEKGVFDFQKVILSSRQAQFFRRLQPLLADADSRILQNFFSFEYARSRVLITRNLREITLKLEKSLYGRLEEERRSLMCARETAKYYRAALAKQFVQKKFSEKSKKYVGEMFERIKDAYSETFDSWTWMSGPTKSLAREKLDEMLTMLGYRAVDRSERDLQFLYRNYPKGDEGYYKTRQDLYHADKTNWLKNLNEIFDLSFTRNLSPTDYRASYLLNNNLVMSAAYLQKPRFSLTYSTAHNFAVLGYLLGHHVSQAFDSDGRSVGRCNKRQVWWEDQEISTYTQKSQCYMDDYTGFLDSEFGSNVQLNRSVSEKTLLADNVGLHLAHRAWKTFVASNGTEKMLPGINLNQDETFFVTFAQQFCEKKTEEEAKKTLESDTLSAKFRILGPLRNFPEFGETFNCPVGSAMNPTQKCQF